MTLSQYYIRLCFYAENVGINDIAEWFLFSFVRNFVQVGVSEGVTIYTKGSRSAIRFPSHCCYCPRISTHYDSCRTQCYSTTRLQVLEMS